jgi:hypothetical protein
MQEQVTDRQVTDRLVTPRRRPASDRLHPLVYKAIAACILIFAWSVWGFAEDGHVAYLIAVVTGFVLISGLEAQRRRRKGEASRGFRRMGIR